jgi:hypothetical protein
MAKDDALKRLGGGRWQTRDGRFAIESDGGRWSLIDSAQTDELGLPLVRGPFTSLTEAKEALEAARTEPARASPLAERIAAAKDRSAGAVAKAARKPAPMGEPPQPPPIPIWLVKLDEPTRTRAQRMLSALEDLAVPDAEALVRQDVTSDEPAVARAVLLRRLALLAEEAAGGDASDEEGAVARIVGTVAEWLSSRGREPGPRLALPGWRLVEEGSDGRRIEVSRSDVERAVRTARRARASG